jgi:hypothetical protein
MSGADGFESRAPVGDRERARVGGDFFRAGLRIADDHRLFGLERLDRRLQRRARGANLLQSPGDRVALGLARGGRGPLLHRADDQRRSRFA